jgi:hypothetical protein
LDNEEKIIEHVDNSDVDDADENGISRETGMSKKYDKRIALLVESCDDEFSRDQMIVLYDIIARTVPHIHADEIKCYHYLLSKYHLLKLQSTKTNIKHRFNYFKKLVGQGEESFG